MDNGQLLLPAEANLGPHISTYHRPRRIGYLSGALRVSTRPEAVTSGPRSHILGVTSAFNTLGWQLRTFIAGDRVPAIMRREAERYVRGSRIRTVGADCFRIMCAAANAKRAWRELGGKVDCVYERFASFNALGRTFKRNGAVWVLETNGVFFKEAKSDRGTMQLSKIARQIELSAYRDCDLLIVVSSALRDSIREYVPLADDKVLVVPNGVDTEFFDLSRCEPKRLFREFTIGFVGRLIRWQGLELLLQTIRELREERGITICVSVVGDGAMRSEWEQLSRELGVADQVKFAGQVARHDIPPLIAGFDVGFSGQKPLVNSRMYHSPLKIYEYMAMSKPVIASAFEDAARVIKHGETGFLFSDQDKSSLKEAVLQAYSQRGELADIGARARVTVAAEHSWLSRVRLVCERIEQAMEARV